VTQAIEVTKVGRVWAGSRLLRVVIERRTAAGGVEVDGYQAGARTSSKR
jgi:hypothetical protein